MGVISIDGSNPFAGQSDPYITSNMTVDEKTATTDYVLNGQLTGCSLPVLFGLRDGLVDSFDWKADPEIIRQINIVGVQEATIENPLVPVSLSFDTSSYKGAVGYTLTIRWSKKQKDDDDDDDDEPFDLINKTWTVSSETNEKGCKTTTTSMSCVPNTSLPEHCNDAALSGATAWVSANIKKESLTNSLEKQGSLDSETLTLNPVTSEVKYTSVSSSNCGDQEKANTPASPATDISYTHCTESSTEYTACEQGYNIITTKHNGEVYKLSGNWEELMEKVNDSVLSQYDGVEDFAGSLNKGGVLTYNFTTKLNGNGDVISQPKAMLINNQTVSHNTSYDGAPDADSKVVSSSSTVNGSLFYLNPSTPPTLLSSLAKDSDALGEAKAAVGDNQRLTSWNYTIDPIANTASYSASFNSIPDDADPEELPALDGFSGVSSYSIDYTPPLGVYDMVQSMNCDDMVFKMGYASRGTITISVSAASGSGFDFTGQATACMDWLTNLTLSSVSDLQVTVDTTKLADDLKSITKTYTASFDGADALTSGGDQINSMY